MMDRRMDARLGDDRSAIRVPDEHHITVDVVKGLTHASGVRVQIAEWTAILAVPGQIESRTRNSRGERPGGAHVPRPRRRATLHGPRRPTFARTQT